MLFRHSSMIILLILISFPLFAYEEVSTARINSTLIDLSDQNVILPKSIVALNNTIEVGIPKDFISDPLLVEDTPSVFFIVDNSGSMWMQNYMRDPAAHRYALVRDLIDTLYSYNPSIEVGVAIFASELYMNSDDDKLFETLPNDTSKHGYIPLLSLNKQYHSDRFGEASGRKLIQNYLTTELVENENPLVYKSDIQKGTNITCAFDAAVSAFQNAQSPKRNHRIIFISDGEATAPDDSEEQERFIEGVNVPATFTIYFSDESVVPPAIVTMTENIAYNDYSESNKYSSYFISSNHSLDSLMQDVMTIIYPELITSEYQGNSATVNSVSINGITTDSIDRNRSAYFDDFFAFQSDTSLFDCRINITRTIRNQSDSGIAYTTYDTTIETSFNIVINDSSQEYSSYTVEELWERSLFFYNDTLTSDDVSLMVTVKTRGSIIHFDYDYTEVLYTFTSKVAKDTVKLKVEKTYDHIQGGAQIEEGNFDLSDSFLQLAPQDTVVVSFQNLKLPLDTISGAIPYIGDGVSIASIQKLIKPNQLSIVTHGKSISINHSFTQNGTLELITLNGRKVATTSILSDLQRFIWNPSVAAGNYILKVTSGDISKVQKIAF